MNKMPKIGDMVRIPKGSRGHENPHAGKLLRITYVGIYDETYTGIPFVWCQFEYKDAGNIASHQLGYTIPKQEGFKK